MSLILPDDLRPYCQQSKEAIDFIYNPFGKKHQTKIDNNYISLYQNIKIERLEK